MTSLQATHALLQCLDLPRCTEVSAVHRSVVFNVQTKDIIRNTVVSPAQIRLADRERMSLTKRIDIYIRDMWALWAESLLPSFIALCSKVDPLSILPTSA